MLSTPEKILFAVLAGVSVYYSYVGFARVVRVILRGGSGSLPRLDRLPARIVRSLVRTFTQTSVFRARPVVSTFHAFIFYGFTFYLLVNAFDVLNGYLPRSVTERLHFGVVGDLYRLAADVLTVLVLLGVVYMLIRRFVVGDHRFRFNDRTHLHEKVADGLIRRDSAIVAFFILLHVGFRFFGESSLERRRRQPAIPSSPSRR